MQTVLPALVIGLAFGNCFAEKRISYSSLSLRKLAHAIYRDFKVVKMIIFSRNIFVFYIFAQNINCGYKVEPPR